MQLLWQSALKLLQAREDSGTLAESRLNYQLNRSGLSVVDRKRVAAWVLDVMRWQTALDAVISWRTDGRDQLRPVQLLLRLALAQLFYTRDMPAVLVAAAARDAARAAGIRRDAWPFTWTFLDDCANGVCVVEGWLGELRRKKPETGYSHPFWLVERWTRQFGDEPTRQILDWNNSMPIRHARLNVLKTTAEALLEQWQAEGVRVEECQRDWIEPGVIFEIIHAPPIEPLASWRQGWFILQDPSTLLPGCLVEPKEGENVLDYCAGDGLSTAWLAQLGGGKIQLHAENGFEDGQSAQPVMTRLGLKGVKLRRAPFAFPETGGHVLLYDKVLVQAPGSGSAALRMGVDRRWNLSPAEIEACAGRQFELLCAVASRVKNGGAIVYATASAEPEENQQVVARFLDAHPQFRLDRERQLLPGFQCVDGVYAARLVCSKPVNRKPVRRLIVTPDLPPVIAPLPVQAIPEPLPSCLALPVAAVTRQFHYEKVGEHFALALHEKPTPKPGPNEVLVRVRAVALGRRDWLALQESHPVPKDRTGLVAGAEGAGVIVAVGQGSSWQTGQRVVTCPYPFWSDGEPDHKQQREALSLTCDGVLSESVVLPDTGLAKLPDAMSFEEGACVPFGGLSAWNALVTRGQIQPGEMVLINGLGGIGVWALQITLAAGAKALTLSRNENKRLRALEMGASRTSAPDNPKLNSYVKSWTHNLGVQHVVLSGGPENVVVCISVLARGGQISCFGGFSGGLTPVNFGTIAARQARLNGVNSGSRAQLDACLQWLVERGVRPVVDRVFAFEEANEAMSHLADASPFGKVVIRVGQ